MSKQKETERGRGLLIGLEYEIEVRDKHGKLISRCKGKSDLFQRAWLVMLRNIAYHDGTSTVVTVSLTDTGGVSRAFYIGGSAQVLYGIMAKRAPANDDTFGIQVGSSDLAWTRLQYALQGKIAHGSGGGQLLYGASTVEDWLDEDTITRYRIIRAFSNTSGSPVTVREIGIVVKNSTSVVAYYLLVCRDVLPSPQTVPDGATLTVRYRLYISYA